MQSEANEINKFDGVDNAIEINKHSFSWGVALKKEDDEEKKEEENKGE